MTVKQAARNKAEASEQRRCCMQPKCCHAAAFNGSCQQGLATRAALCQPTLSELLGAMAPTSNHWQQSNKLI